MSSHQWLVMGIATAILAQAVLLGGMVARAAYPLWAGQEVRVKTTPVDPRSWFRGNYARLNYDFSRLPTAAFGDSKPERSGEVVYVTMVEKDGLYEATSASLTRPDSGVFLRARVTHAGDPTIRLRYGIEAWFAPKEQALELEKRLRRVGAIATLMVSDSGRAALRAIEPPKVR